MKKLFLCILFLFASSINAATVLDMHIDFFLGKKFFNSKQYDCSRFFFNKVAAASFDTSARSFKSKIYNALIQIKFNEFKNSLFIIEDIKFFYGSHEKCLKEKFYFRLLYSFSLYKISKENDSFFLFFDDDRYHEDLILKSLIEINEGIKWSKSLYASSFRNKVESERMEHEFRLIRDYIDKQSYFSAIHRVELHINRNDLIKFHYLELLFLLLKSYNSLHLDEYSEYLLLFILK